MTTNPLVKKMRMMRDQRILIQNPPEGFLKILREFPEEVIVRHEADGVFDFILLFVNNIAGLEEYAPAAIKAGKFDCILWIAYPKRSAEIQTDINRDTGWDVVRNSGMRPVAQVAIDQTWPALRFRSVEQVGK